MKPSKRENNNNPISLFKGFYDSIRNNSVNADIENIEKIVNAAYDITKDMADARCTKKPEAEYIEVEVETGVQMPYDISGETLQRYGEIKKHAELGHIGPMKEMPFLIDPDLETLLDTEISNMFYHQNATALNIQTFLLIATQTADGNAMNKIINGATFDSSLLLDEQTPVIKAFHLATLLDNQGGCLSQLIEKIPLQKQSVDHLISYATSLYGQNSKDTPNSAASTLMNIRIDAAGNDAKREIGISTEREIEKISEKFDLALHKNQLQVNEWNAIRESRQKKYFQTGTPDESCLTL